MHPAIIRTAVIARSTVKEVATHVEVSLFGISALAGRHPTDGVVFVKPSISELIIFKPSGVTVGTTASQKGTTSHPDRDVKTDKRILGFGYLLDVLVGQGRLSNGGTTMSTKAERDVT